MSWSFNYLRRLQKDIERYKEKMAYIVSLERGIAEQKELVDLSQELDKLIIDYQNFRKTLAVHQNLPYSVDKYMSPCSTIIQPDKQTATVKDRQQDTITVLQSEDGGIIKVFDSRERRFATCNSGSSIWLANKICAETGCEVLAVLTSKGNVVGIVRTKLIKSLCREKLLSPRASEKYVRAHDVYNKIPVSLFVLDKDLFVQFANEEAVRSFSDVLPRSYMFKRAELIFSCCFSKHYEEFISSELWQTLNDGKDHNEVEAKLLNHIPLLANIKVVRRGYETDYIILSFFNVKDLQYRLEEASHSADELAQALNLFLPQEIEERIKVIPEYKEINNREAGTITVVAIIKDGGYWHVINCLKILAQLERLSALTLLGVNKELLVQVIMVHDVGKVQPQLQVGDVVNPLETFENGKSHALRGAKLCTQLGYSEEIALLVRYHHHALDELPGDFPMEFLPYLRLLKLIDGLSAATTRRNAIIGFELTDTSLIVREDNELEQYRQNHVLEFENSVLRNIDEPVLASGK